jgi:predicted CopG family antitoxin
MGTRTIGLDDEAYERLVAEKRDDESFSDTVKRLTETVGSDWRHGFGKYETAGEELVDVARESRERVAAGLADRQRRALDAMADEADGG